MNFGAQTIWVDQIICIRIGHLQLLQLYTFIQTSQETTYIFIKYRSTQIASICKCMCIQYIKKSLKSIIKMRSDSFEKQASPIDVNTLLKQHNATATESASISFTKFSLIYAKRLVKKCVEVARMKGALTEKDIQYIYENDKGIKSPFLEMEHADRKGKTIEAINSNGLKDIQFANSDEQNYTPPLSNIQTVRIGSQPYSNFPSGNNFQLIFQKLTS